METIIIVPHFFYNRSRRCYGAVCYAPYETVPQGEISAYLIESIDDASLGGWTCNEHLTDAFNRPYISAKDMVKKDADCIAKVLRILNNEFKNRGKEFRVELHYREMR